MKYKSYNLDITITNENNETPLDLAIKLERNEIIELLNNFHNEYTKLRNKNSN